MWLENSVFYEDLRDIADRKEIIWSNLEGKTLLLTGATGLIGYTLLSAIMYKSSFMTEPPHVYALVREKERAEKRFHELLMAYPDHLHLLVGDVVNLPPIDGPVDYIIHGASATASKFFVEKPVETIQIAVHGTENLLELARKKESLGFVYLSSMEVYGKGHKGKLLTESDLGDIDCLSVRSCYSESKRMCENLCVCYSSEYGVPTRIARLAQTFGPGVPSDDVRVFAEFARCAMDGRDIVMQTDGKSERMYVYTADAAAAILCLLLRPEASGAYNIANKDTFCSIRDFAEYTMKTLGKPAQKVRCADSSDNKEKKKYPPGHFLQLDTTRLCDIGWLPYRNLEEMLQRMVAASWK